MYKKGDKLVCKNTLISSGELLFIKNKSYIIGNSQGYYYISIACEEYTNMQNNRRTTIILIKDTINETFYTEKELRKLKLEKLENEIF